MNLMIEKLIKDNLTPEGRVAIKNPPQRGTFVIMDCSECKRFIKWHRTRKGITPAEFSTSSDMIRYGICSDCRYRNDLLKRLRRSVKHAIKISKQ